MNIDTKLRKQGYIVGVAAETPEGEPNILRIRGNGVDITVLEDDEETLERLADTDAHKHRLLSLEGADAEELHKSGVKSAVSAGLSKKEDADKSIKAWQEQQ